MKKYLLVGLLALYVGCSEKSRFQSILGKEYRDIDEFPEFSDLKDAGGTFIEDGDDSGLSINHYQNDRFHLLTLNTVRNEPDGKAMYTAIDLVEIDGVADDEVILLMGCGRNHEEDSRIIAVAKNEDSEYLTNISRAWIVNIEAGKFEPISTDGLGCINEGYGME